MIKNVTNRRVKLFIFGPESIGILRQVPELTIIFKYVERKTATKPHINPVVHA